MAATRNSDVNLVIRARDEAAKTIDSVTAALNKLLGGQEAVAGSAGKTAASLADMVAAAASLDKAVAGINSAANRGDQAFARQNTSLKESREQYAALRAQMEGAGRVLEELRAKQAQIGPQQGGPQKLAEQIKLVELEYGNLERQVIKTASSIEAQESRIGSSRSTLQQLSSTAIAAAEAQDRLAQSIRSRQELEARTAAAPTITASQLQQRIAPAATTRAVDNGAGFEALAAQMQRVEAEAQKVRASIDPIGEASRRAAADIDKLREQQRLGALTAAEYAEAEKRVQAQLAATKSELDGSAEARRVADREREAQALRSAGLAYQMFEARVREGARAMREAEAAARSDADAIQRLREDLNPLEAAQRRVFTEQQRYKRLLDEGKISIDEYRGKQRLLGEEFSRVSERLAQGNRAGGGSLGLFGLRPYELQNLGYQINDVFTQIASGTSITQTLAQQGGQILQLFPRVTAGIVAAFKSPPILAAVAAVGAFVLAMKEAADEVERYRNLSATLTVNASGGLYDARTLAEGAATLAGYGIAAKDATAAFRTFINEGIAPDRLIQFTRTAQDMVDTMGVKLPDAAKTLTDAFTGGYDAIVRLDQSTNFLTAAEREHIRTLFESGDAQRARTEAYEIFAGKQDEAAGKARGPWTEAIRALSGAWQSFLKLLADSAIVEGISNALKDLAQSATSVINALRGARTAADISYDIDKQYRAIETLNQAINRGLDPFGLARKEIEWRVEKVKALNAELAKVKANGGAATGDGEGGGAAAGGGPINNSDANSQMRKAANDKNPELQKEAELQRLRAKGQEGLTRAERQRREYLAGEIASMQEMRSSGNALIAAERERLAIAQERRVVEREVAAQQQRALQQGSTPQGAARNLIMEREQFRSKAYWDVNAYRVGYGSDTVTNPNGTVSRVTANTRTTEMAALADLDRRIKEFQDVIKRQIGSDRFGAFNAQQQASLTSVAYNYGDLPDRILKAVRTGTASEIAAAIRGLGGDNKGINRNRRNIEANLFEAAPNAELDQNNADRLADQIEKQTKFNEKIDGENERRQKTVDTLRVEGNLTGVKLIEAQRARAIEDAALTAQQEAKKAGLTLDDDRLNKIRETAAAEFDVTHQKQLQAAKAAEVQDPVDAAVARRQTLQQQLEAAQRVGDTNLAGSLEEALVDTNASLDGLIQKAIAFWEAMGGPEAERAIAKLQGIQVTIGNTGTQFLMTGKQINESIAGGVANAFDRFAKNVAEGKNVFDSLKDAFLQFASDFLRQIAQMIIQQAIFNAIGGATGSGGAGGAISGVIGGLFHSGGVVGESGASRMVNPAWFTNAVRYHTGGIVGLAPDEQAAVLRKGEEVLTREDPRHRANGGMGSGGGGGTTKIVNVFDAGAAVEEALNTPAGEKAILNHVRNNPQAWKAALGG